MPKDDMIAELEWWLKSGEIAGYPDLVKLLTDVLDIIIRET